MLIVVLAVAIVASVPLTGGDVRRLGALELRHVWAPPAAIVVQTVAIDAVPTIQWLAVGLHIGSYLLLCWWLWANRHVAGLWLVGAGGIANFLAISTNGGVMPARPEALATAGLPVGEGFANSAAATDAPLWFLGDVFAVPASWPLANVFSVGDVVLLVGLAWLVHRTCRGARSASATADRRLAARTGTSSAATSPTAPSPAGTGVPSRGRRLIGGTHRWTLAEVREDHHRMPRPDADAQDSRRATDPPRTRESQDARDSRDAQDASFTRAA